MWGIEMLRKREQRLPEAQAELFGGSLPLKTQVIAHRKDFEALFEGFTGMRAISYVVSPDLLLDFFDRRGFTDVEIIVGENLSESYRRSLQEKDVEVTERLEELIDKGVLRVLVPERTIHTKLYILDRDGVTRVIQTSANLTETAQEARRQVNYAWYIDLPNGHHLLDQVMKDYQSHLQSCKLFMKDLQELISERDDTDKRQIIEAWLKGVAGEEQDVETRRVFHELAVSLTESTDPKEESIAILKLPESVDARKRIERVLEPLKPAPMPDRRMHVSSSAFIRYVYEKHNIPLLVLSREKNEIRLGIDGPMNILSEPPSSPEAVTKALEHIEGYLNTVDFGESVDRRSVKTSMFEALLYIFFTPFAHEYMKAKRIKYGLIDIRGPRYLYIYGPAQNGKSTFLRFAFKMLAQRTMELLSGQGFDKTRIYAAALTGTAFPLIFDDVDPSRAVGLEDVFKSYWERWWRDEFAWPQIVITSNTARLDEWAKSRIKRIDFDVHFAPKENAKQRLAELFAQDNPVFRWFSYLYLQHLNRDEFPGDDEIGLARVVMKELYEFAGRSLPDFFPAEPIEKLYDPGRREWRDLIYGVGKATVRWEGNRLLVNFSKDMQPWDVKEYQGYLPQTIKCKRKGNTLIIENPEEFNRWLGKSLKNRGILSRILGSK